MRICTLILMFGIVACGGSSGDKEEEVIKTDLVSLRIEPAEITLETDGDLPGVVNFIAYATTDSGAEVETEMVSWSVSNLSAGDVDTAGRFESSTLNGGITTVTATHVGIEAVATVTIVYKQDLILGEMSSAIIDAFDAATPTPGDYPAIAYPHDGVTVPRNLNGLAFGWTLAPDTEVSRLRLRSGITDMRVYTTETEWLTTADVWATIAASNTEGLVEISISSANWDGTTLSRVASGPGMEMTVNRLDARGSVLYWEPDPMAGGGMGAGNIMRIPFGSLEAEPFWTADDLDTTSGDGSNCMGCHSLSEVNDQMIVTHNGVNGQFSIIDVSDPDNPQMEALKPGRATFHSASPDGRFLVGVNEGQASLYSLFDGGEIHTVETDGLVSHPDWAPDGESVVFARYTSEFGTDHDLEFETGEIIQLSWNGSTFGDPEVLVAREDNRNNYYPAYSPDGDYIVFNRSEPRTWVPPNGHTKENSTSSYAHPAAELWLMTRAGEHLTRLDAANSEGDLQNSYPKWGPLPDDDVLWLAFSSKRSYAIDPSGGKPQVWVSAIDPAKIVDGEDPSSTAFWLPAQNTDTDNHASIWWSK